MKLAVMQPYLFPYIGYFQLVKAVDVFVFYDDVNYINKGWINRNKILLNENEYLFTIPCIKASQNKLIKDIEYDNNHRDFKKILGTMNQVYSKAPYFNEVWTLISTVFERDLKFISTLAQESVIQISKYLELNAVFKSSSDFHSETVGMERADRLIEICKREKANEFVNATGGRALYEKSYFQNNGININFINSEGAIEYKQFSNEFIPWLSIIDILMFNSVAEVQQMLYKYKLE
ncbi:WbqC family protein [Aequorivita capsosiphonis]|uniref:WbqC family protein n=1 Tax=Aequorivita capsosiphonis TaxID=487317 RepID=UPI000423BAD8|nr:WbqC family protein [Aequorivita capsosiphonis]